MLTEKQRDRKMTAGLRNGEKNEISYTYPIKIQNERENGGRIIFKEYG